MFTATNPIVDMDIDGALDEFDQALGFYGYTAQLECNHRDQREINVRYDGELLATFTEGQSDWLDDLASYAYRISGGAAAA